MIKVRFLTDYNTYPSGTEAMLEPKKAHALAARRIVKIIHDYTDRVMRSRSD